MTPTIRIPRLTALAFRLLPLAALSSAACHYDDSCVPGIVAKATYEMTFTAEILDRLGRSSCADLAVVDNLTVGSVVDVYVPPGGQNVEADVGDCTVPLAQVTSSVGVTLDPPSPHPEQPATDLGPDMFVTDAQVTVQGCEVQWALAGVGTLSDPNKMWAIRSISIDGTPTPDACSAAFPNLVSGPGYCQDDWVISLQTK